MLEPDTYVQQSDAMSPNMWRNYVRDRTQAALMYITEYETAQEWERDPQYDKQQVLQPVTDYLRQGRPSKTTNRHSLEQRWYPP